MLFVCVCISAVSSLGQGLVHAMDSIRGLQPCLQSIFTLFCSGIQQFGQIVLGPVAALSGTVPLFLQTIDLLQIFVYVDHIVLGCKICGCTDLS